MDMAAFSPTFEEMENASHLHVDGDPVAQGPPDVQGYSVPHRLDDEARHVRGDHIYNATSMDVVKRFEKLIYEHMQ
jgi:hypothetical protein